MITCVLAAPFGYREDTRAIIHDSVIEFADKRNLIGSLRLDWKRQELERRFGFGSSLRLSWKREEEEEMARRREAAHEALERRL